MFQLFYHCKQAQVKADDRKRRLQNYHNLTIELRKFIREKVTREQGSPAQIVGHLQKKGERCVCIETIYAYIRQTGLQAKTYGNIADISSNIGNDKQHSHTML